MKWKQDFEEYNRDETSRKVLFLYSQHTRREIERLQSAFGFVDVP